MTREQLDFRIREIVSQRLKVDPAVVTDQARFMDDLGADSVDVVELLMDFQEHLGVAIPDADAERLVCAQDASAYLAAKLGL